MIPRSLLLAACSESKTNIYNDDKHAFAGQLNSLTHPRALLVLHDCGIFSEMVVLSRLWTMMMMIMTMIIRPYGQLELWAPSSGV
jgi:hypothetical protein